VVGGAILDSARDGERRDGRLQRGALADFEEGYIRDSPSRGDFRIWGFDPGHHAKVGRFGERQVADTRRFREVALDGGCRPNVRDLSSGET